MTSLNAMRAILLRRALALMDYPAGIAAAAMVIIYIDLWVWK